MNLNFMHKNVAYSIMWSKSSYVIQAVSQVYKLSHKSN